MEASGFEPPNSERAVLQTAAFSHFARPPEWRGTESNRRHKELQSFALPTELPSHFTVPTGFGPVISSVTGRRDNPYTKGPYCGNRIWTYDLRVMSPTSYQTAPSRDYKEDVGFEPTRGQNPPDGFQNRSLQPDLGNPPLCCFAANDPYEIWTHVTAVKGRCLNHLTNGSDLILSANAIIYITEIISACQDFYLFFYLAPCLSASAI